MKILLASLLSLSTIGGGLIPVAANFNNHSTQNISDQASSTVDLGREILIRTENGERGAYFNFSWNWANGGPTSIEFLGNGLKTTVWWGSDNYQNAFKKESINPDGDFNTLFRETHRDFLAAQVTKITYRVKKMNDWTAEFTLRLSTTRYNSLSTTTGQAAFGPKMIFSN